MTMMDQPPKTVSAYFKYIEAWRNNGQFEGLEFR
jgi:hypothetical protein